MYKPFLPDRIYRFLFISLGLIYIAGLFVPLMDNDSAHHAIIALRMHLTGDYVSLYDYSQDYLDKPHLLFWLSAFCYKIFGVTTFAYKFPSLLFTILGTWSVYRLGRTLYNNDVGKLAALIIASAFSYILANNDVRMDAILTSCIAFSTWQLVEFVNHKKFLNVAGAALGLALGFCTKGHIAVFTPGIALLFYIVYQRNWKIFLNWKWLAMLLIFAVLISPVVYCYYLQFNLHPEKIVRGKDHINGVKFILLNQSIDRFEGGMGELSSNDRFFFFHSFAWAFSPWSIITFIAFFIRIKNCVRRKEEWLTTGTFAVMMVLISLSDFKLPHYLNILFPVCALMTAWFIWGRQSKDRWINPVFIIQLVFSFLLLIACIIVSVWIFPIKNIWIIACSVILLALVFYFIISDSYDRLQKSILIPVSTIILVFFLLNTNFYPQLLSYQGGNELAKTIKGKVDPADIWFEKSSYSPSFNFYTSSLRRPFDDSVFLSGKRVWVFVEERFLDDFKKQGYIFGVQYEAVRYKVTRLSTKFLNPATRDKQCTRLLLIEILGKN